MTVTRVTRFGFVNSYLVPDEDGLIVIDTMVPRSAKTILQAAKALRAPIRTIALTHAHGDHIGSLDALAGALPDAEVVISARDARYLDKVMTLDPGEPRDRLRGSYPGARTAPTRTVVGGDRIGPLHVVASPGHTPGHVSFYDARDGTLYCGDAYTTLGGVATAAEPRPWFPLVGLATWHRPTARQSADALRELDPSRLAAGHGKVVENPGPAMDAAIGRCAMEAAAPPDRAAVIAAGRAYHRRRRSV
jgi:glyoxylase-like metal-dependent hydrolase (beta-lactamase superfamily II)